MKKVFKSVGISAAYFASFFAIQIWVTLVWIFLFLAHTVKDRGLILFEDTALFTKLYVEGLSSSITGILLISSLLTILIMWAFFKLRKKNFCREVGLQKTSGMNLLLAVLFGIGVCFAVDLITGLLPIPDSVMTEFETRHGMLLQGNRWLNFLAVAIVGPVSEEVCFRGLCYTRLKQGMRPIWAGLISALFFGLAHGNPVWILVGLLFGLALAWIFETTESLWTCIAVHMTNNTISQISAYFPVSQGLWWALIGLGLTLLVISIYFLRRNNPKETISA